MYRLVEQWLAGGERQVDFCFRHGLKVSVLGYWLKKYRLEKDHDQESGGFVPVEVSRGLDLQIEICYPNGVKIRALAGLDVQFLRELAGQC